MITTYIHYITWLQQKANKTHILPTSNTLTNTYIIQEQRIKLNNDIT